MSRQSSAAEVRSLRGSLKSFKGWITRRIKEASLASQTVLSSRNASDDINQLTTALENLEMSRIQYASTLRTLIRCDPENTIMWTEQLSLEMKRIQPVARKTAWLLLVKRHQLNNFGAISASLAKHFDAIKLLLKRSPLLKVSDIVRNERMIRAIFCRRFLPLLV